MNKNTESENKNTKKPKPTDDLDDFIFKDEEIKYYSER